MAKINGSWPKLASLIGSAPLVGIKTGCNEAFLIDTATRNRLVDSDPGCQPLIRPYVRGEDVERWSINWDQVWMIALKSSMNERWPWADAGNDAEAIFARTYPSIYSRLQPFRSQLERRQDQGRYWWELRSCAYWAQFDKPKLTYQEIQYHCWFGLSTAGTCGNNKTYILPTDDLWILAVLNSPLMWWHNWRYLPHMKDEAMFPAAYLMEKLPIASPTAEQRATTESAVRRLIELTTTRQTSTRQSLVWLKVELDVIKPTMKLQTLVDLDAESFVAEIKKSRGKGPTLTAQALAALRAEYARSVEPLRRTKTEAAALEASLAATVNAAYGLTADEVSLMWQTAPPRMPVSPQNIESTG